MQIRLSFVFLLLSTLFLSAFGLGQNSCAGDVCANGSVKFNGKVQIAANGAAPVLQSITVSPSSTTVTQGSTVGYIATCNYSDGSTQDCTVNDPLTQVATTWASGNPAVATIGGTADPIPISATGVGSTTITATNGAIVSNAAAITVTNFSISPATLPNGTVGQPYSATFVASGMNGAVTFSLASGAFPPCCTLTGANSQIFGSVGVNLTAADFTGSPYNFCILATDSIAQTFQQCYTFIVNPNVQGNTVASLPRTWVNNHENDAGSYDITVTVKNAGGTYNCGGAGANAGGGTGFNQALIDAEIQRQVNNKSTNIIIDRPSQGCSITVSGTISVIDLPNCTGAGAPYAGCTGADTSTKPIHVTSSNPLPAGVRVGYIPISTISRANTGTVTVVTTIPHLLTNGDAVTIRRVTGGTFDFNGIYGVAVVNATTFTYQQKYLCPGGNTCPVESGTVTIPFSEVAGPNTLIQHKNNNLASLCTTGGGVSLVTGVAQAHNLLWDNVEICVQGQTIGSPIMTWGTPAPVLPGNFGHDIGINQFYGHGCLSGLNVPTNIPVWPLPAPCTGGEAEAKTFARMNCITCWLTNGFVDQSYEQGVDTHSVGTYDGPGPFKFTNNTFRGGSTQIHWGGTQATITGLVPSDLEFRLNTTTRDPNLWFLARNSCGNGNTSALTIKNNAEQKNAAFFLFDGNEFANNWCDGQSGQSWLPNPRACSSAGCLGGNDTHVHDISMQYNWWHDSGAWMSTSGRSFGAGNGNGVAFPLFAVDILHNLVTNYNRLDYLGPLLSNKSTGVSFLEGSAQNFTCNAAADANAIVTLSGCTSNSVNTPYTTMSPGDYALVTGCSNANFNTSQNPLITSNPYQLGPVTYQGPNSIAGVGGVTGCRLDNLQGYPGLMNARHNTLYYSGSSSQQTPFVNAGSIAFMKNITVADNIFATQPRGGAMGWIAGTLPEGSASSKSGQAYDIPTLLVRNNAWVSRTKSLYSDYNPRGTEDTTSATSFFPAATACNGTVNSACIGFRDDGLVINPTEAHYITTYSSTTSNETITTGADHHMVAGEHVRIIPLNASCIANIFSAATTSDTTVLQVLSTTQVILSGPSAGQNVSCSGAAGYTTAPGIIVPSQASMRSFRLLSTSTLHNAASDSTDVGVDESQIEQHMILNQYCTGVGVPDSRCTSASFPQ